MQSSFAALGASPYVSEGVWDAPESAPCCDSRSERNLKHKAMADWLVTAPSVLVHAAGPAVMEHFLQWPRWLHGATLSGQQRTSGEAAAKGSARSEVMPQPLEAALRDPSSFGFFAACRRRSGHGCSASVGKWNLALLDGVEGAPRPAPAVWLAQIQEAFGVAMQQPSWTWDETDMRIEILIVHDLRDPSRHAGGSSDEAGFPEHFDPAVWGALYDDGTRRSSILPCRFQPGRLSWEVCAQRLRSQAGVPEGEAPASARYGLYRVREFKASMFEILRRMWRLSAGPVLRKNFVDAVRAYWSGMTPPVSLHVRKRVWSLYPAVSLHSLSPWDDGGGLLPPGDVAVRCCYEPPPESQDTHAPDDDFTIQFSPAEIVRNAEIVALTVQLANEHSEWSNAERDPEGVRSRRDSDGVASGLRRRLPERGTPAPAGLGRSAAPGSRRAFGSPSEGVREPPLPSLGSLLTGLGAGDAKGSPASLPDPIPVSALLEEFIQTHLPTEVLEQHKGIQASEAAAMLLATNAVHVEGWNDEAESCVRSILVGTTTHPLTGLRLAEGLLMRISGSPERKLGLPPGINVLYDRPRETTDVYRLNRMTRVAVAAGAEGLVWEDLRRAWVCWARTYRTVVASLATSFLLAGLDGLSRMPRAYLCPVLRAAWIRTLHEISRRWMPGRVGFPLDNRGENVARFDHAGLLAATTTL
jgi:hypothetical protein